MDNNVINNLNKKINTDNDDVLNMDKFYKPGITFEELCHLIQDEHEDYELTDIKRLILDSYQQKLIEQLERQNDHKVIR